MLKIHGRQTSSNVQCVMWLVGELGLEHERIDVGGTFGGTQTPEYLAKNPMGLVPVLEDGDLTLFESQAILRYLGARYGSTTMWPTDPVARASIDQWMEWTKVNVLPALIYKIFWQLIRTSAADRDHALLEEGRTQLAPLMALAEAQIAAHGWLAGPEMSLADISFGTGLYRYFTLEFTRPDLPHLQDYYERLCARPSYRSHVMVSYEPLRVPGA